jgi:Protein of unknown function (DUF4232)
VGQQEPRGRSLPYGLVGAGFLIQLVAAFRSARYRPSFLDPNDPLPCSCSPAEAADALRQLWWAVGVGAALVVVGAALIVRSLGDHRPTPGRRFPAALHALVVGVGGAGACAVLSGPVVVALLVGEHAVPGAVLCVGLALAGTVAAADRAVGPGWSSPRRAWLTGLAAGGLVTGAGVAVFGRVPDLPPGPALAVVGGVVGLVVLAARTLLAPRGHRSRTALAVGGTAALAAASLVAVAVAVPEALLPRPDVPAVAAPRPAAPTTESPTSTTTPPPPAPETTPPPPPVRADVPCSAGDLRFHVPGFDAAMGARAASIRATNVGAQPCWVEGRPVVTLLQGGHPLTLTVEPGETPTGGTPVVQRVGIAPGGTAVALLTWRTYAGWADDTTPQALTVALGPGQPKADARIVAPPGAGPAPFDIADGGAWGIAPWAPPWN